MWDVTEIGTLFSKLTEISTHTSRVGCDLPKLPFCGRKEISTHTSRVGCDNDAHLSHSSNHISTHTSRVGCDVRFVAT